MLTHPFSQTYTSPVHDLRYFDESPDANDETLGWIGAAVGAGTSILSGLLGGLFAPCGGKNVACGLQGITSFGNQAITTLGQIKQLMLSGQVSPAEAVSNAQRIAGALSDGNVVYQAKKGKDAAALAQFKEQANAAVNELIALGPQVQKQQAEQAAAIAESGGPSGGGSGISSTMLLLIGGGLALYLLMQNRGNTQ